MEDQRKEGKNEGKKKRKHRMSACIWDTLAGAHFDEGEYCGYNRTTTYGLSYGVLTEE